MRVEGLNSQFESKVNEKSLGPTKPTIPTHSIEDYPWDPFLPTLAQGLFVTLATCYNICYHGRS